jgi:signal transduction histidine kinase
VADIWKLGSCAAVASLPEGWLAVAGFPAVSWGGAGDNFAAMKKSRRISLRALLVVSIAVVALMAVVGTNPRPGQGLGLAYENGEVVVASVEFGSTAYLQGIRPGQVVSRLDNQDLLELPAQDKLGYALSWGPWSSITTMSREDARTAEARYTQLVAAAKSGVIPWLSNPTIGCDLNTGTCSFQLPTGQTTEFEVPAGRPAQPVQMCILTSGGELVLETSAQTETRDAGQLCVSSGNPPTYTYSGPFGDQRVLNGYEPVSPAPIGFGLAVLLLGWLAIGRGWVGSGLKPYALTLPLATAIPLLTVPICNYPSEWAVVVGSLLVPLAMLPLAMDFVGRLEGRRRRRFMALFVVGLAILATVAGLLIPEFRYQEVPGFALVRAVVAVQLASIVVLALLLLPKRVLHLDMRQRAFVALASVATFVFLASIKVSDYTFVSEMRLLRAILAGAVVFIPGLLLALRRAPAGTAVGTAGQSPKARIESTDIALAAMTPGIAAICLIHPSSVLLWPIVLWLIAVPVAANFLLRPLGRAATSAQRQRDLVVAATEAERMRIAADIHDEALQDLTMLVRRLDAAGDTANADVAREIAERLRAICGDLRLPLLDDLGVGPALEWLSGRLGLAPESITLDRSAAEESRLPADVELAVFRIAQEALSNAVKHGEPPIVVRYRARTDGVELTVDDHGSGIPAGAAELAERSGRMGLMNMTQRAEAIGARLQIGRKPEGGTRVSFIWERATAPAGAAAPSPA